MFARAAGTSLVSKKRHCIGGELSLSLMTALLLLLFAFGARGLNAHAIRTDELFTIANIGGFNPPYSPLQIIDSIVTYSPDHVPLYFLLGAGWASLVGWTQTALRASSLLTAMLMIAWLYRFGSDIFDRRAGLIAASLAGASAYLMLHNHDFRMYPLLLLLAIAHCWLYWRLIGRRSRFGTWLLFTLSAAALVYTHSTALLLFAGLGMHHVVIAPKSRTWLHAAAGWLVAALLYLPYLPSLLAGVQGAAQVLNEKQEAAGAGELIGVFLLLLHNGAPWLLTLIAILATLGMVRGRDWAGARFLVLPLGMLAAIILLNEILGFVPLSRMRYFLIFFFPVSLVIGRGLSLLPRWPVMAALCIGFWCAAGLQFYYSRDLLQYIGGMGHPRNYPPLQSYVNHLRGQVRPQDYLLGFSFIRYVNHVHKHGKSAADYYTQLQLGIDGAFVRSRAFGTWLEEEMRAAIDGHPYLLFAYDPRDPPRGLESALYLLHRGYQACDVLVDGLDLRVQRFVDSMLDCDRQYAPIGYDNGIRVLDREAAHDLDSQTLRILTGWTIPDDVSLLDFNVSFQVLDAGGVNVRQVDRHLDEHMLKWRRLDLPIAGLTPGGYRLVMIVYGREDGAKLTGRDLATGEQGRMLPILSFTIAE